MDLILSTASANPSPILSASHGLRALVVVYELPAGPLGLLSYHKWSFVVRSITKGDRSGRHAWRNPHQTTSGGRLEISYGECPRADASERCSASRRSFLHVHDYLLIYHRISSQIAGRLYHDLLIPKLMRLASFGIHPGLEVSMGAPLSRNVSQQLYRPCQVLLLPGTTPNTYHIACTASSFSQAIQPSPSCTMSRG